MSATPQKESVRELTFAGLLSRYRPFLLDLRNAALFLVAYLSAYGCSRFFAQRTGTRLWLPDSVLLCALLVAPRKKWWLYVLMTMPSRFVPGLRPQVAAWFLWLTWSNDVAKGLLAASLLRYSSGTPIRFNTVRRYATYLGIAVLLTPMLSALFGALTRHLGLGHAFWPAFGQWFLGDVLSALVITPTLLLWFSREYRLLRPRLFEAIVWGIGFALCLWYAVLFSRFDQTIVAIYAPFPFLVWAALRLGAIGASSGLSLTTLFVIFGISRQQGPFSYLIAHHMHFLQLFLAILALPIMFVAILFEERHVVEAELRESQEKLNENYNRARDLAGRLIQAQEEERRRIGRELHDGVAQEIALLTIELDRLESTPADQLAEAHGQLSGLKRHAEEVAKSVREVARQVHSVSLQHLGIAKALVGLCRTFAQQHHVEVTVETEPLDNLPDDLNLCLFRVAQEALTNSVMHGRAKLITVKLARDRDLLRLQIQDAGIGFDPATIVEGLGMVSMRERLRLVGGRLTVSSSPGNGALIEAVVDLDKVQL
jgi:signal transduction histidine kinase